MSAARNSSTAAIRRYSDPKYQDAHTNLYSKSIISPIRPVLPPGVSQAEYDLAVEEWVQILGPDHVYRQHEVQQYIDPYELNEDGPLRKVPSGAVCPSTLLEAQRVLKIANQHKIPLWTFSRGKNLGYGGPAPRLTGSVALDLHRMNKIIEVNEEYSYAVVEPGVTFTDLYQYCKEKKLRVWPSVPSLGWGSVIGNTVDRGTGFLPTANHHQNMAGLEILLADGDVVRTGQFGISNSASAHLSKFTFGPSIEGLFLQSNLGIVTKMGIWLTPQPEAYASCFFDVPEFEDIENLVDTLGALRQHGIIPNTIFVSNIVEVVSMMKRKVQVWSSQGPIPAKEIRTIQDSLKLGYWNARFGLFGPQGIIKAQIEEIQKRVAARAPTGTFRFEIFSAEAGEALDASQIPDPHGGMFVGVPSLWSMPMVGFQLPEKATTSEQEAAGIAGHGDFSSIIPSNGKVVLGWVQESRQICEKHGFDLFCDFFMHERHIIFVNFQTFDKGQVHHQKAVQAIFADMYQAAQIRRFSNYRSHVNHMDAIADLYDFNGHAYRRFVEKLKDALDPNSVLSPGKQGMWGRNYSEHRDASILNPHSLPVRTRL